MYCNVNPVLIESEKKKCFPAAVGMFGAASYTLAVGGVFFFFFCLFLCFFFGPMPLFLYTCRWFGRREAGSCGYTQLRRCSSALKWLLFAVGFFWVNILLLQKRKKRWHFSRCTGISFNISTSLNQGWLMCITSVHWKLCQQHRAVHSSLQPSSHSPGVVYWCVAVPQRHAPPTQLDWDTTQLVPACSHLAQNMFRPWLYYTDTWAYIHRSIHPNVRKSEAWLLASRPDMIFFFF